MYFSTGKHSSKSVSNTVREEEGVNPIRASMAPIDNTPYEKPMSHIIVEPYREASVNA